MILSLQTRLKGSLLRIQSELVVASLYGKYCNFSTVMHRNIIYGIKKGRPATQSTCILITVLIAGKYVDW